VDRVVLGWHGPMQQWHGVAKYAWRVGLAENDGGTVHAKEVEFDGLDSLLLLANDLRALHPGLGVRACCCHDPAHRSASSLGGAAKGLRVGDFDLAQLFLGHLRTALADAERGERGVDSLGVRRNLLLEPVHVNDHLAALGSAKASVLWRVTTTTFLHSGFLIRSCTMRPPTFPVAPSTIAEYCAFATPLIVPVPCS